MTAAVAAAGAGGFAHAVHYGIVASGLVGIAAVLLPGLAQRLAAPVESPDDVHARRMAALRAGLATGRPVSTSAAVAAQPATAPLPTAARLGLPVVAVSSLAAAGAHAAVAPLHLDGTFAVAAFFPVVAATQLAWAAVALTGRADRGLLLAGVVGNLALLGTWVVSRTSGVPVLAPAPEPIGPWDLACAGWELVVVAGATTMLVRSAVPLRPARWLEWHPAARQWLLGCALVLAVFSVSGASA